MIAFLQRDLRLATRAGGGFGLALVFFLILVLLVPFGVGPDTAVLAKIAPGMLWLGALLACLLSLDRLLALDWEDGALELLATSPLPMEAVIALKALAHWLTTGLPLVLVAPGLGLMLSLPAEGYLWLVVSLALGTPTLSMIGGFGRQGADVMTPDQPHQRGRKHHNPTIYRHQGRWDMKIDNFHRGAHAVIIRTIKKSPDQTTR